MEVQFDEVIAAGRHVHCYLNRYYIARLSECAEGWAIDICNKPCGTAPTRAEAEGVVRMWADLFAQSFQRGQKPSGEP